MFIALGCGHHAASGSGEPQAPWRYAARGDAELQGPRRERALVHRTAWHSTGELAQEGHSLAGHLGLALCIPCAVCAFNLTCTVAYAVCVPSLFTSMVRT